MAKAVLMARQSADGRTCDPTELQRSPVPAQALIEAASSGPLKRDKRSIRSEALLISLWQP
jgi:hypothetical protein